MAIDAYNRGEKISYDRLPDELKTHRNQTSFKDRFKVVEGNDEACHTVLAHLAKDGHYFIHPDRAQCRSITVREAATNSVDTGSKEEQAPTDTTVSQDNIDITIELNEPSIANLGKIKDQILERISIVAPMAYESASDDIDAFISTWKEIAKDENLYYFVTNTENNKRLLSYYGQPITGKEKPTLNSMRDVEQSSTVYLYEEGGAL